jgi:hypothetical protein
VTPAAINASAHGPVLPVVGAGLQGHVGRCALRAIAGRLQCEHFGMRPALALVPAFPDHLVAVHEHATDHRVGTGGEHGAFGQAQGARHHPMVDGGERHGDRRW